MRVSINGLALPAALAAAMAMTLGCASDKHAKSGAASSASSGEGSVSHACALKSGGHEVLRLATAPDVKCAQKGDWLRLESNTGHIDIWLASGAKTVDDAAARVAEQIKPEFKDFKASGAPAAMTVAGSPAKRLAGRGVEADDGDPGDADVIVFKTGDHVFVACAHGESLSAANKQWLATIVQTAKAP